MITYNGEPLPSKVLKVVLESASLVLDGMPPTHGYPEVRFENTVFSFGNQDGGISVTIRPDRLEVERIHRRIAWLESRMAEASYRIPPQITGNDELMAVAVKKKNEADSAVASIAAEIAVEKGRIAKVAKEDVRVFFPWEFFKYGVSIHPAVKKWLPTVTSPAMGNISTSSEAFAEPLPSPSDEEEKPTVKSSPAPLSSASLGGTRQRGRPKKK